MIDPNDAILDDLAEARAKIESARSLLEAQGGGMDQISLATSRLERIEAAVARIERSVAEQAAASHTG